MLYLSLAVFLCLTVCIVVGVFLFPRSISIKLINASPKNISIPKSNKTNPFIIINVSMLCYILLYSESPSLLVLNLSGSLRGEDILGQK